MMPILHYTTREPRPGSNWQAVGVVGEGPEPVGLLLGGAIDAREFGAGSHEYVRMGRPAVAWSSVVDALRMQRWLKKWTIGKLGNLAATTFGTVTETTGIPGVLCF